MILKTRTEGITGEFPDEAQLVETEAVQIFNVKDSCYVYAIRKDQE